MEADGDNPQMPQPQPTGGPPPPEENRMVSDQTDEPPPYGAVDPHPEYKAAYEPPGQPLPYPETNQSATIAYPTHSASYYPTNATVYPPTGSTVVVHATGFTDGPITAQCSNCFKIVTTRVEYVNGSFTWMMCCLICIFCPLFCWLIPFCMVGMKDAYHYCPQCNHLMGTHTRG